LPTLYFSVLMLAHLLDHFMFSSSRLTRKTKSIIFGICAFAIVGSFWWFKGLAFGIDGPINDHKGLLWRKVRESFLDALFTIDVVTSELEHLQLMSCFVMFKSCSRTNRCL
jgi:C-terminal four TMM region of protein-O-mannosyltransferase